MPRIPITVLADSLAMPRNEVGSKVLWSETWPLLLMEKLENKGHRVSVINYSKRGRTIDTVLGNDFYESVELIRPKFVVIQIGIVDCVPRIISKFERKLLNSFYFPIPIRDYIIKSRSQNREKIVKKNPLAKVYTKPKIFEDCFNKFRNRLTSCADENVKVILIPILANLEFMQKKNPGSKENIEMYNRIIEDISAQGEWFLLNTDWINSNESIFSDDGYHLSPKGNEKLAEELSILINNSLNENS